MGDKKNEEAYKQVAQIQLKIIRNKLAEPSATHVDVLEFWKNQQK